MYGQMMWVTVTSSRGMLKAKCSEASDVHWAAFCECEWVLISFMASSCLCALETWCSSESRIFLVWFNWSTLMYSGISFGFQYLLDLSWLKTFIILNSQFRISSCQECVTRPVETEPYCLFAFVSRPVSVLVLLNAGTLGLRNRWSIFIFFLLMPGTCILPHVSEFMQWTGLYVRESALTWCALWKGY